MRKTALLAALLLLALCASAQAFDLKEFITGPYGDLLDDKIKPQEYLKQTEKLLPTIGDDPDYKAAVLGGRAHAFWKLGDNAKAEAEGKKSLAIKPDNFFACGVLADLYASKGDYAKAAEQMEAAARGEPKLAEHFNGVAINLRQKDQAISPASIWKAFDENEVAAEDQYKGKQVTVKGKVESITTNALGKAQVKFGVDKYGLSGVLCEFEKANRSQAATLKKGQTVFITGQCSGMVIKNVVLRDSAVLE